MGDLGNGLQVRHVVSRVANALDIDSLGLVVNGGSDVLGVVTVDELGLDAEAGQEDLELVVSAAVQVGCGDNVVTGMGEGRDSDELGTLAGCSGQGGDTTLESCYALLKDIVRGLFP